MGIVIDWSTVKMNISFSDIWDEFEKTGKDLLATTTAEGQARFADYNTFLLRLRPELAQNAETAIRLNEQTHWDTLVIQTDRLAIRALSGLEALDTSIKNQLRGALIAAVRIFIRLAVVV